MTPARLPRPLHPGAWWLWALGLAAAASRTTNPLLLLLIVAVAGYVVAARRPATPWSRSYALFLRLGLVVLGIRLVLQVLVGAGVPGTVLFRLPSVPLPTWAAGVTIGGRVTLEGLAGAAYDGLRIAVLLACVGAANALASPGRLLKLLPGSLYEAGVAVTVAISFAPQAVASVGRIRAARRLRGRASTGLRGLRGLAIPVLEDALERSVALAAAMDSRGFGRRAERSAADRRRSGALTVGGLLAVCAGLYGLFDTGAPGLLGLPLVAAGTLATAAGLVVGGRGSGRSRYRPDPWARSEWLVTASGLAVVSAVTAGGAALHPTVSPLAAPALPLLPLAGILLALLPAWAAPPLPGPAPATRAVPAPVAA